MKTFYSPRIYLAHLPTPVQPLRCLGRKLGAELYVKRDDRTGAELSGNKIRKLELAMADALSFNADTVITCGGVQSNHCRTTVLAAATLGLGCRLLLRTSEPAKPAAAGRHSADLLFSMVQPIFDT